MLGLASESEVLELEARAAQDIEIKAELVANQKALETYILAFSAQPNTRVKDAIFETISQHTKTIEVKMPQRKSGSFTYYWMAASILLLAFSALFNYILFNNLQKTEGQLAEAIAQNQKIAQENTINKANYNAANEKLAIVNQAGNKVIELKGLPLAPLAKVLVNFNATKSQVFISSVNLPKPPKGKQYQFWAIVEGKPVSGGMLALDIQIDSLVQMKDFSNAQAFAISLEVEGGVASPTMEAIYVMGSI